MFHNRNYVKNILKFNLSWWVKNGSIEIENGSQWRKWMEKSNEIDSDLITPIVSK